MYFHGRACRVRSGHVVCACTSVLCVIYCVRVRYKRGRSRGLHGIHSRLPGLAYCHATRRHLFVGPARSIGMSFRVGQSHKDVLFNISNAQSKARSSVVLVLRIFAEIRFVIRQIHPCIFRRSAFVAVPHTYKEDLWRPSTFGARCLEGRATKIVSLPVAPNTCDKAATACFAGGTPR